ncbi:MAG: chemotaxis protein CheW [Proteobacteria bacterium]|nr:chemotaxis protein CheW [Pseudomonadota bacterium]
MSDQDVNDSLEVLAAGAKEFVTVMVDGQCLGIPVLSVHDVLNAQSITRIPKAPPSVVGVLNLRGRIVTAVDLRIHLGFKEREEGMKSMSVVVEHNGDPFSLLIDSVGEVLALPDSQYEKTPVTLDERLRSVSSGIYRLEEGIMVVLDVARLLEFKVEDAA